MVERQINKEKLLLLDKLKVLIIEKVLRMIAMRVEAQSFQMRNLKTLY